MNRFGHQKTKNILLERKRPNRTGTQCVIWGKVLSFFLLWGVFDSQPTTTTRQSANQPALGLEFHVYIRNELTNIIEII